jgi:hypothetical protein
MGKVLENLITLEKSDKPPTSSATTTKPVTKLRARFEPETTSVGRSAR